MPTDVVAPERATRNGLPPAAGPAIEATGLTKRYATKPPVTALDGLDLRVPTGTVFALLGPNGAGKSTAIKVLTTLTRPDAGTATVAGVDVLADPPKVRHRIGVVGQKPGFDGMATGRENLELQGAIYDLRGADLKRAVQDALQRVDLTEAADRAAKTYSGGMQRRLDIAMGLLHRPSVLFLDEPTTGLDPEARAEMWTQIARLSGKDGMTVLLTTHYLEEADALAAEVAIIDRGRVVAQGTPDALKRDLRGDTLQVELATDADPQLVAEALAPLQITVTGRILRARTPDGAAALPRALQALAAHALAVSSATIARPSLDDVYLHHAGRSFSQAHEEDHR
jgi:ABC-2 type transport system ATP-binding protein